jgi:hypothetical protein
MNDKQSMNDFLDSERKNSQKIKNEIKKIDKEFNIFHKRFQMNLKKYRIKPLNDIKNSDNKKNINESIYEHISKFINNLHSIDYSENVEQKNNKENKEEKEDKEKKEEIKQKSIDQEKKLLSHRPLLKKSNSINNLKPLNISSSNSARNNIDKSKCKIKKFISVNESSKKIKYRLKKFNQKNESKEESSSDNDNNNHKKLPFINQNSYIMISRPESVIYKYLHENYKSRKLLPYIINLPNLQY